MVSGVHPKLSSITADSVTDGPDDFLIGPGSETRFRVWCDVGSVNRGPFIQDIPGPESCWNGYCRIAVVEGRMARKAPCNPVSEIAPASNSITIGSLLRYAAQSNEREDHRQCGCLPHLASGRVGWLPPTIRGVAPQLQGWCDGSTGGA